MRSKPIVPFVAAAVLSVLALAGVQERTHAAAPKSEVDATHQDIEKTLGLVPTFMKAYPPSGIAGAWEEMKSIELSPDTAIPGKYKELIGLAVAAQVPCHYCTYFHTQAAKLHGATEDELREAVAMAGQARHWSTLLNGSQTDMETFKADFGRMSGGGAAPTEESAGAAAAPVKVVDAASARKDIQQTLGVYPHFMDAVPPAALPGAWKMWKGVEIGKTAIPEKYKSLISLGVAAQIPCTYCIVADTQSARAAGATDQELGEALVMAAITRNWSTVLNGNQTDERVFRNETDRIMRHLKKQAAEAKSASAAH